MSHQNIIVTRVLASKCFTNLRNLVLFCDRNQTLTGLHERERPKHCWKGLLLWKKSLCSSVLKPVDAGPKIASQLKAGLV